MKVLVAIDESEFAEKAFDWYVANMYQDGTEVVVCHEAEQPTFPTIGMFAGAHGGAAYPQEEINRIMALHKKRLEELATKYAEKCKAKKIHYKVIVDTVDGGAGQGIVKRAEGVGADMIVIGTRGLGMIRRTILGSVSDYVVHHAKVPVVVCHV